MRQDVVVIDQPPQAGLSWRHAATVLLLALTVPVFVAAGLTAVLLLPVMLVATAAVRLLRLMSREPRPVAVQRRR